MMVEEAIRNGTWVPAMGGLYGGEFLFYLVEGGTRKVVSADWDEGQSPGVIFLLLLSSRNSPSLFLDCFKNYFEHQC